MRLSLYAGMSLFAIAALNEARQLDASQALAQSETDVSVAQDAASELTLAGVQATEEFNTLSQTETGGKKKKTLDKKIKAAKKALAKKSRKAKKCKECCNKPCVKKLKIKLPKNATHVDQATMVKKVKAAKTVDGIRSGVRALQCARNKVAKTSKCQPNRQMGG